MHLSSKGIWNAERGDKFRIYVHFDSNVNSIDDEHNIYYLHQKKNMFMYGSIGAIHENLLLMEMNVLIQLSRFSAIISIRGVKSRFLPLSESKGTLQC